MYSVVLSLERTSLPASACICLILGHPITP